MLDNLRKGNLRTKLLNEYCKNIPLGTAWTGAFFDFCSRLDVHLFYFVNMIGPFHLLGTEISGREWVLSSTSAAVSTSIFFTSST